MSPDLDVPRGLASHRFRAMGSDVQVLLPEGAGGVDAVEALFEEWEDALSRFRPGSELSRLNDRAGAPVRVGPILLAAVEASLDAACATGGLFDPTLRHELVRMGYDRTFEALDGGAPPSTVRPQGGGAWRRVVVDRDDATVTLPAGTGFDLGGIAKGMAVDAALELLAALGADAALVSAGGDLAVRGLPPGRRAWPVLVGSDPDGPVVPLVRGALATSGKERRHWKQGRTERHHLVDPATGEPAAGGLRRVTAVGGSCRAAEVGATAAFVAGRRLGATVLARLGLAGMLVTETGGASCVGRWPGGGLEHAA
ncbi:MAG TPA: FAD:protein FMN transferase [Gaiella sp.]|nr:FAD:protein FMN transferase [Gaiella sp.]